MIKFQLAGFSIKSRDN